MSVSALSQNMTLMLGRNRLKSSVVTCLPPCHRSPLHRGCTIPSSSNCNCYSFCSGPSCSDSEMKLRTKGERLPSKNKAHELDVKRHGMAALQKPGEGDAAFRQSWAGVAQAALLDTETSEFLFPAPRINSGTVFK